MLCAGVLGSSVMSFLMVRRNQFFALTCVTLFAVSLVRYRISYDSTDRVFSAPESYRLAHNLAEKGQFANPFATLDTGPSAHMAPAFPAYLALLIRAFGGGSVGKYAIELTAAIILSAQLALFPVFSDALGMGRFNGIIGAIFWIVAKVGTVSQLNHESIALYSWESLYAAVLLAITACCYRRYLDLPETRLAWLLGCLMGALILTSPAAGAILLSWLTWLAFRDNQARLIKSNLVLVLLPLLIVAPWLLRNYLVFNRIVSVRDNFGLELSISNNDCAMFGFQQNIDSGCFAKVHPNESIDEARKVLAYGEPRYNDLKLRDAQFWIRDHPLRFFRLSALRTIAFWLPPATEGPYSLVGRGRRSERFAIYLVTLLSVPGLFILFRQDSVSAIVCAICLIFFPLVYYVVEYSYRYRYPILWVTFLLGALPITLVVKRIGRSLSLARSRSSVTRTVVATCKEYRFISSTGTKGVSTVPTATETLARDFRKLRVILELPESAFNVRPNSRRGVVG